jgi:sugar lactone lactonase YvrE
VDVTVSSTYLYILDRGFRRVLEVSLAGGTPTVIAGGGSTGYTDGFGISAQFNSPNAITNTQDSLFIADTCNNTIRRIDLDTNIVTSLLPPEPGCGSGSSDSDKLNSPTDLTTNGSQLYIADKENSAIKRIDLNDCEKQEWTNCKFDKIINLNNQPISIVTDGSYLYAGTDDHKIHRYNLNGSLIDNNLFPISAITPQSLTTDGQSLIYSEEGRNRIVRLHSKGFDN